MMKCYCNQSHPICTLLRISFRMKLNILSATMSRTGTKGCAAKIRLEALA